MKQIIVNAPMLPLPNLQKPFEIETNRDNFVTRRKTNMLHLRKD